jgi:hypothetical protein
MPLKGTLSGSYAAPVTLDNGAYDNPVTIRGIVSLASAGVDLTAASAWLIANTGSILGPTAANSYGVLFDAGGYVGNRSGGVISSNVGADIRGGLGLVANFGTIAGAGGNAVAIGGSVYNAGLLSSTGTAAVSMLGEGTFDSAMVGNAAAGTIKGANGGVLFNAGRWSVANAGTNRRWRRHWCRRPTEPVAELLWPRRAQRHDHEYRYHCRREGGDFRGRVHRQHRPHWW